MSVMYRLMYRLGFTPWDRINPPELVELIAGPDPLTPGRALDLGSGNGTKAVFMATRGWHVTAVEAVPRALAEARRRAAKAGVKIDFRASDVTHLDKLGLQPGYTLVFDFGCFHGLSRKQRDAYARGVNELTSSGATLLLMAFSKMSPPVMSGVTAAELKERFGPGWTLKWAHPHQSEGTSAMSRAAAMWYCLTRD